MNFLRLNWGKRLAAARATIAGADADFSWRAQLEARVLRFLVSRYGAALEAPPLAPLPVFEGETPYGRSRALLSESQQRGRLNHIARAARARPPEVAPIFDFKLEEGFDKQVQLEALRSQARRERYRTRRERGYW